MPTTAVRTALRSDPVWCAYALGDLHPPHDRHCQWLVEQADGAVVLVYRAFKVPVLFSHGPATAVARLYAQIAEEPRLYLSVPPHHLGEVGRHWRLDVRTAMLRMVLAESPPIPDGVERLTSADLTDLRALYADGEGRAEGPAFFTEAMLDEGVYFGRRVSCTLVAAAGTHLVCPAESVAAIGNVCTLSSCRGNGHARAVTAAVAGTLRRDGIGTVVLNVAVANGAARAVYERLGFREHTGFWEGEVVTTPPT